MRWGACQVQVAEDGTTTRLVAGDELVVELSWVGAVGAPAEIEDDDEVEHTLRTPEGLLMQRQAILDIWRSRWVLTREASRPQAVEDRLRVRPGPEYSLWSWGSGVTAVLAICPAHAGGPVLGLRLEQGYLEQFASAAGRAAVDYLIAPSGAELSPGQRLVTAMVADWYASTDDLAARLPRWLSDCQLDEDEPWSADLADYGISGPSGIEVDYVDDLVEVSGPLGRSVIDVQTPRGLSRVPLEWVPSEQAVLRDVASAALGRGDLGPAGALCVQLATDRHLAWPGEPGEDVLDRLDWAATDSVLGAAFGLARGRALGEAALVSEALRMLARLPVGIGYGRVAMSAWLVSISVGLDAQARCHDLLGRPAVGRTASLESSLLHYRSEDFGAAELAGVANRLGGLLPGEAPLLGWLEIARLVGVLELCPPEWDQAGRYAHVAEKARGQVLCGYADGRITDPEPLAWLLLNAGLGAAG